MPKGNLRIDSQSHLSEKLNTKRLEKISFDGYVCISSRIVSLMVMLVCSRQSDVLLVNNIRICIIPDNMQKWG